MRVAIIGSRTFTDYQVAREYLDGIEITHIVSGGAKGADTIGEQYAILNGIDITIHRPDYKQFGKSAPFIRNKQIVDDCDLVIAFWNGKSSGTKYALDYAKQQETEVKLCVI